MNAVLVVSDDEPTLQSLRTELRPDQPEVDGITSELKADCPNCKSKTVNVNPTDGGWANPELEPSARRR